MTLKDHATPAVPSYGAVCSTLNDNALGQEEEDLFSHRTEDQVRDDQHLPLQSPSPQLSSPAKKSYVELSMLYILYGVSYSLVVPALPGLLLLLTKGDAARSAMLFGAVTAMRYVLEFFSSPLLGSLADSYGRKAVFKLALVVSAVELLLLALWPSIPMLFFTRALSGLGDGGVAACYAMITDLALHNGDSVSQQYGLLSAMHGLAFFIGPFLGGKLMEIDIRLCFAAAFATAITCVVLTSALLEETNPVQSSKRKNNKGASTPHLNGKAHEENITEIERKALIQDMDDTSIADCDTSDLNPLRALYLNILDPALQELMLPFAICALNHGMSFIWFMYLHRQFDAPSSTIGLFLSFHGLLNALAQGVGLRLLVPEFMSERSAVLSGILLAAWHTLGYAFCAQLRQLFVVALVFALSAVHFPALKAIVVCESLACRPEGRNSIANLQGAISSVRTLSSAAGSLLFSALFSLGISKEINLPELPFYVGAVLYVGALIALFLALHNIDQAKSRMNSDEQTPLTQPMQCV